MEFLVRKILHGICPRENRKHAPRGLASIIPRKKKNWKFAHQSDINERKYLGTITLKGHEDMDLPPRYRQRSW